MLNCVPQIFPYFINLNSAFESTVGSPTRTLQVHSDVGGSNIVGNLVTDLLREVQYERKGKGSVYFEPLHVQYLPIQNEFIEIKWPRRMESWCCLEKAILSSPFTSKGNKRNLYSSVNISVLTMRGGSLTRFKPDDQWGNGLIDLIGSSVKDILGTAIESGWKGFKSSKRIGDVKTNIVKGLTEGFRRGAKRKAQEVVTKELAKRAKRIKDIFGE